MVFFLSAFEYNQLPTHMRQLIDGVPHVKSDVGWVRVLLRRG